MKQRTHLRIIALPVALLIAGTGCSAGSGSPARTVPSDSVVVESTPGPTGLATDSVIWAIGDSLMVGAHDQLMNAWPTMVIDAQEGRSFESGIDVLEHQLASGTPDVLVFALGTNNGATSEQTERVMRLASDIDEVVFVSVSVPRPWESSTNAVLVETAAIYPNATLVDWKTGSQVGVGLFRADGYHLTGDGIGAWVDMIMAEATD